MPEPKEIRYRLEGRLQWESRTRSSSVPAGAPLPRITHLMALAIKLDTLLHRYPDLSGWELARRGCVSRTRLTQILNLLHLAPDIQERLLSLAPPPQGREVITEKALRRLAGEWHWGRQREHFNKLLSRRTGLTRANGKG